MSGILFADIAGSTRLYRQLGDATADRLVDAALAGVAAIAGDVGGRLIKTIGDCAFCEFPTANAAALAAVRFQREGGRPPAGEAVHLQFRIGFSSGAVVHRDGDVFGDTVNVAYRLAEMARPGEILTLQTVVDELDDVHRRMARAFDETVLKGVDRQLGVFQLLWDRRAATDIFMLPAEQRVPPVQAHLILRYAGRAIDVHPALLPLTLGRDLGCHLVIPAQFASRHHAHIELRRGKYTLCDSSTNGCFVLPDGSAVEPMYVRNESFTLVGSGYLGLGEKPYPESAHVVRYEIAAGPSADSAAPTLPDFGAIAPRS